MLLFIDPLSTKLLGLLKYFLGDNGGMGAMHIVLRLFSEVALLGEGQGGGIGFLTEGVANVLLVRENIGNRGFLPVGRAVCRWESPTGQILGNLRLAPATEIFGEDSGN